MKKRLFLSLPIVFILLTGCGTPLISEGNGSIFTEATAFMGTPSLTPAVPWSGMIAMARETSDQRDIYLVNIDGSGLTPLTNDAGWDNWPSWSPDGTRLAFTCRQAKPGLGGGICVINADGSERAQLTDTDEWEPSWSPDGKYISFASKRDGNPEIYMMNADGSNQIRLTHDPASDWTASWSPDSKRIVFNSWRDGDGNGELYIMDVSDGGLIGDSELIRLTYNESHDAFPSWSPDGTRIVFMSERDGNQEIYIMNADGSNQHRLTYTESLESFPRWSPDGAWIAFTVLAMSSTVSSYDIAIMDVEGGRIQWITMGTPENEDCPSWRP